MKTVTFCGHSDILASDMPGIKEKLYTEIEKLINQGASEFLLGGYGDFDLMCAKVIRELKQKNTDIISVLVVPYIDRDYDKTLYDCSEYPPIETVPKRLAIIKRNEYMVNKSDAVVAYVTHDWGGAYQTLCYAKTKKKNIISIS